jgi:hypothetical protein
VAAGTAVAEGAPQGRAALGRRCRPSGDLSLVAQHEATFERPLRVRGVETRWASVGWGGCKRLVAVLQPCRLLPGSRFELGRGLVDLLRTMSEH